MQYSFDREEHQVDLKPHGNSKDEKPFTRTKPSTLSLLKESVKTKPPRKALREVENVLGGVMGAKLSCDLPRDRKQVKNMKYCSSTGHSSMQADVLAHVMQMCKDSFGSEDVFVRSVEAAPEPMCVLATEQQLVDIERFCTYQPSSVLSIDPTFNLGPFYVTPTTYHNLFVTTPRRNHPILLGPVLIHKTKTFRPFHYFGSTLIRLNPALIGLRAFGTDGEPELIKAFRLLFPNAVHLRCTNHLRQNIKHKLHELNCSAQSVCSEFLADVFGKKVGSHLEAGLVDLDSPSSFDKALKALQPKWNNLERSCNPGNSEPQFYSWFVKYKAHDLTTGVLPEVRRQAGLSDPTVLYTTNSSEALNHLIKQEVEWKESSLPKVIDSLKKVADDNISELQKCVIGRSVWKFTPLYTSLTVSEHSWFHVFSDSKKKQHMKKVFSQKLIPTSATDQSGGVAFQEQSSSKSLLSVPITLVEVEGLAQSTLENIWKKAETLVNDGHVVAVPWSTNAKDRFVKSFSSTAPHLVQVDARKGSYVCDANCPMFKGFSICSHVVATAEVNGDLHHFLESIKSKCAPNLSSIADYGMPSGSGRKGGVSKRKRKRSLQPVETRSVRPSFGQSPLIPPMSLPAPSSSSPCNSTFQPSFSLPVSSLTQTIPLTSNPGIPVCTAGVTPGMSAAAAAATPALPVCTAGVTPMLPLNILTGTPTQPFSTTTTGSGTPVTPMLPLNILTGTPTQPFSTTTTGSGTPVSIGPQVTYPTACSSGQIVVGSHVLNLSMSTPSAVTSSQSTSNPSRAKQPFTLKLKTNLIKVCQACRKGFDGTNDTMGLVVARPERRLVSNVATGATFLGRESNSHYHLHMSCITRADPIFKTSHDPVIPTTLKLNVYQKSLLVYLF